MSLENAVFGVVLDQKIFEMFMAGYTQEEIAKEVNMPQQTLADHLKELPNLEKFPKSVKLSALFQDPDFKPPLYDLWSFGKLTNVPLKMKRFYQLLIKP